MSSSQVMLALTGPLVGIAFGAVVGIFAFGARKLLRSRR